MSWWKALTAVGVALLIVGALLTRDSLGRECAVQDVWLGAPDGTPIFAKLYVPHASAGTPMPGVVLAHGYMANLQMMEAAFVRAFIAQGFVILNVDRRGHGRSSGSLWSSPPRPEARLENFDPEIRIAVAHLRGVPAVDPDRIALVGHSDGARAAIMAACADWSIGATVAISATLHPGDWINPVAPKNLLLLYGSEEAFVGRADQANLFAKATDGRPIVEDRVFGSLRDEDARQFVSIPGAQHVGVIYHPDALRRTIGWVGHALTLASSRETTPHGPPLVPLALGLGGGILLLIGLIARLPGGTSYVLPEHSEMGGMTRGAALYCTGVFLLAIGGSARVAGAIEPLLAWVPLDGGRWFASLPLGVALALSAAAFLALVVPVRRLALRAAAAPWYALRWSDLTLGGAIGVAVAATTMLAASTWYEPVPSSAKLAVLPFYFSVFFICFAALEWWIRVLVTTSIGSPMRRPLAYSAGFVGVAVVFYASDLPNGPGILRVPFGLMVAYLLLAGGLALFPAMANRVLSIAVAVSVVATWITILVCPLY